MRDTPVSRIPITNAADRLLRRHDSGRNKIEAA